MNNQLIDDKIQELIQLLEKETPNTATRFDLEITGTSYSYHISYKTAEQLKKDHISMRNIKGDFIS